MHSLTRLFSRRRPAGFSFGGARASHLAAALGRPGGRQGSLGNGRRRRFRGFVELGANALKLDGLNITDPDGGSVQPNQTSTGKFRSSLDLKLAKSGTYRISLVSETAMASYKLNGEMKRWRGNVADLKKEIPAGAEELAVSTTLGRLETFVTAGKPNATALKPVGSGLELIPLDHPSESWPANRPVPLLLDGQPLPGLTVAVCRRRQVSRRAQGNGADHRCQGRIHRQLADAADVLDQRRLPGARHCAGRPAAPADASKTLQLQRHFRGAAAINLRYGRVRLRSAHPFACVLA